MFDLKNQKQQTNREHWPVAMRPWWSSRIPAPPCWTSALSGYPEAVRAGPSPKQGKPKLSLPSKNTQLSPDYPPCHHTSHLPACLQTPERPSPSPASPSSPHQPRPALPGPLSSVGSPLRSAHTHIHEKQHVTQMQTCRETHQNNQKRAWEKTWEPFFRMKRRVSPFSAGLHDPGPALCTSPSAWCSAARWPELFLFTNTDGRGRCSKRLQLHDFYPNAFSLQTTTLSFLPSFALQLTWNKQHLYYVQITRLAQLLKYLK